MAEIKIVAWQVIEPEPTLFSVALDLSLVSQDAWRTSPFRGDLDELSALVSEKESGFAGPTGDRVMRHFNIIYVVEYVDDRWCGERLEDRVIQSDSDGGGGEFHFVPVKHRLDLVFDEPNLRRHFNRIECCFSRKWDVDFMGAFPIAFKSVSIASKP